MPYIRLQWPIFIENCYECGKHISFQWPVAYLAWKRPKAKAFADLFTKELLTYVTPPAVFARDAIIADHLKNVQWETVQTIHIPRGKSWGAADHNPPEQE